MKKISFVLILCFLFQGCASISFYMIGSGKYEATIVPLSQRKDCTFEDFMVSKSEAYAYRFGAIGAIIDLGLVVNYSLKLNPVGLQLFGVFMYTNQHCACHSFDRCYSYL